MANGHDLNGKNLHWNFFQKVNENINDFLSLGKKLTFIFNPQGSNKSLKMELVYIKNPKQRTKNMNCFIDLLHKM